MRPSSWPSDGRPRFIVSEVTGALNLGVGGTSTPRGLSCIVLDRARCHALVREYKTETDGKRYDHLGRDERAEKVRAMAAEHAERLNAEAGVIA